MKKADPVHFSFRILVIAAAAIFLTSCNSIFYFPDSNQYTQPEKLGAPYQDISFDSYDGKKLDAWFFAAQNSTKPLGTIIQFHGNGQNMTAHWLSLGWVIKHGYNLVAFDYRGYGKSEGEATGPRAIALDGLAALNLAWDLNQKNGAGKFIVHAQSLGGAVALKSLEGFAHKDQIDLLVLDSTFVSYKRVAFRVAASHWVTFILSPLAWLFMSDKYAGTKTLAENKAPVLIMHDDKDPVVPFSNGVELSEKVKASQVFWKLDGGMHVGAFARDPPPYREQYLDLLSQLGTPVKSPKSPFHQLRSGDQ